jgi:DNA polymerase-4
VVPVKVACVLVPDFEVAVELVRRPELGGRPVVVGGLPHERKVVRSRSPEAAAYGVTEGMPLRRARALCPEAVFLPPKERFYQETFDRLLKVLGGFSPTIETSAEDWGLRTESCSAHTAPGGTDPGRGEPRVRPGAGRSQGSPLRASPAVLGPHSSVLVYLDAAGLERLFGPDRELGRRISEAVERETGLRPQVGIGSGKFVARVAALQTGPGSALVVEEGKERSFLAPMPVGLLPCSKEMQRRLALLGLRTLGQLADLPSGALGEQFGPEGMEAHRLARGMEDAPLIPREAPRLLEEGMEIDPPTEQSDLLLSTTSTLAERLSARMRSEFLACREVALRLGFSDGATVRLSTTLHEPTDDAGELMRAVGRLIGRLRGAGVAAGFAPARGSWDGDALPYEERTPVKGAATELISSAPCGGFDISSLRLSLSSFEGRVEEQLGLFPSRAGSLRKVRRAVQRIEEQFGGKTIRPLAELEGEKAAVPLRVTVDEDGRPAALFLEGRPEPVRELCNRWRVREEWWRREIYRDYYRLITESGRLCVVFRDLTPLLPSPWGKGEKPAHWFLERIYA